MVTAIRAAIAADPATDGRLPLVAQGAGPPDLFDGAQCNHLRRQGTVLFFIPLCRNIRPQCSQVVESRPRFPARAIRAAGGIPGSVGDCRLPLVAQGAGPPDFFVRPDGDIPRGERTVPVVIPLFCQFRIVCGKNSALILSIIPQDDHLPPQQM